MKKTRKIIAILLTVLTLMSVISAATPVFAAEMTETTETENAETTTENTETTGTEETKSTTDEPEILNEMVEWRSESTKYFRNSDGSYTAAQYAYPVHYKENGEWKEIDNTLNEETIKENLFNSEKEFVAKNTNTPATFPDEFKKDGSKQITVTAKGYNISFAPKNSKNNFRTNSGSIKEREELESVKIVEKTDKNFNGQASALKTTDTGKTFNTNKNNKKEKFKVENRAGAVVYENVFNNVDLEYELNNSQIKESIIINEKQDTYIFEFNMDLGELHPVLCENGSINLCSDKGGKNPVAKIEAPYMVDSLGEYSDAVSMTIVQSGEEYVLTVTADENWLNDKARAYPVVIDPTINLNISRSDVIDNYVDDFDASESHPLAYHLYAGYSSLGKTRAYVKFNLPDLPNDNCIISNAFIVYYQASVDKSSTDGYLTIHKVTENWNNTDASLLPTWNKKPNFDNKALDYAKIQYNNGDEARAYQFDITKTVKEWYEGGTNYGLLLKSKDESVVNRVQLYSAENNYTNGYPAIYVTFRDNKGLESYWSYSSYSIGAAGNAHINDYTGNLVYELPILSSISEIAPLTLTAYFNNYCAGEKLTAGKNGSSRTTLGKGFRLNIQQTVLPSTEYGMEAESAVKYPYVYTDADGTEHYLFKETEDGKTVYKDEDGLGLTMTTDCDITATYQITDKAHNNYYFNTEGNLGIISDKNGNRITISFATPGEDDDFRAKTRISKITDGAGHTFTFNYYSSTTGDYIASITDNAERTVNFTTINGYIREITYPDETKTQIAYENETEGLIDYIIDNDGYALNFDYTPKSNGRRVKTVKEKGATNSSNTSFITGQIVTFDRSRYNTTVIRTAGVNGIHYATNAAKGDDDIITTLQFDNSGRPTSQQVSLGNGTQSVAGVYNYTSESSSLASKNKISSTAGLGKNIVNYVSDSNAQSFDSWSKNNSSNAAATAKSVNTQAYIGANSIELNCTSITNAGDGVWAYQNIDNLTGGKSYTLSAYVKVTSFETSLAYQNLGASVAISSRGATENVTVFSETLTSVTSTATDDGWRRISVSLTLPDDANGARIYLELRSVVGTAYFDCIQFEYGNAANSYNLLENSSFESYNKSSLIPEKWTAAGVSKLTASTGTILEGTVNSEAKNGDYCFKIKGEPASSKGVYQTVPVNGNKNDTYIVSGWAMADAVNTTHHYTIDDKGTATTDDDEIGKYTALFEIVVSVIYEDSAGQKHYETRASAKFNTTISGWQYSTQAFSLLSTENPSYEPVGIRIMPRYNKQANYAYFDHIQLIKDAAPSYTYDNEGNIISVAENAKQQTNAEYDDKNNLTSYRDVLGNVTTLNYDSKNNLSVIESPKEVFAENFYNSSGNITAQETRSNSTSSNSSLIIRSETEYFGADADSGINANAYVKSTSDEHGNKTTYVRNWKTGKIKSVTNPLKTVTSYGYDEDYNTLESVSADQSVVGYTYNGNQLTDILFRSSGGGVSESYSFDYDEFGNVGQTSVGNQLLSKNIYDENNGPLKSTEYGNGDKITNTYTEFGNLKKVVKTDENGNETNPYSWQYNSAGVTTMHRDAANGRRTLYYYDSIGRLIRQEIRTNANPNHTHIGSIEYGFDLRNNLTDTAFEIGGRTVTQKYFYTKVKDNNGNYITATENYAKDNLPTRFKLFSDRYVDYSYDALNRLNLKTLTTDSPIYTNYLYKTSDRNGENQSTYRTTQLGGEIIDETSYSYTYNAVGNITKITTSTRANPNTSETAIGTRKNYRSYEYDDLSQLTRENNETGKKTKVWNYDALGNIESVKIFNYNNTTATSDLGNCSSAINYVYTDEGKNGWNRLLTSVEYKTRNTKGALEITKSQTISYDAIGNPVEYLDHDMRWFGRQLQTVNVGANTTDTTDDKTLSFTYGADGLRGTKTVTTGGNTVKSEYYYLNGLLAYEKRGTEELYFFYDSMGHLTSIRHFTNNANDNRYIYYVTTNSMGDVIGIYNSAGELKASYEYDAWGNVIAITDASGIEITDQTHIAHINPIRYRGYYYDSETKLYYLQSRYYNPEIGRFINADKLVSGIGGSLLGNNLYTYCFNNPTNASDSTGHWTGFDDLIAATVGAVAGVVSQFLGDVVTSVVNKKWETSNWQTYVGAAVGGAAGGVAALYSGPMCSAFISGAVSSFVGQSLEKITSETTTSFTTITENSIYAGIDCAAISFIIPTPQSNYIKGFQLEFDNSMVNIANRTTKEMSLSTFGKGMLSSVYTDTGSALLESSIQNFATSYEDENVIEIIS